MIRPKASVLPESALIPQRNLLQPPPNQFTHEVIANQPYCYSETDNFDEPAGTFSAGTLVVLLSHEGGPLCRVADSQGIYVVTAFDGLRPISAGK